jgi:3-dehydroquinate synthase
MAHPNLHQVHHGHARIEQRFAPQYSYPVLFTHGMFEVSNLSLLDALTGSRAGTRARVMVIVDDGLRAASPGLVPAIASYFAAHSARVELVGEPIGMVGGEAAKNDPALIQQLLARMFAARLDRHSYLLVVGGGAVLDAAGYAGSLFHRGLRLVRAPSTLLAQDDAGVGVKNGVNAFGQKNALGTFSVPHAVINDFALLRTLSLRDHIAGIAEAIKVALLRDGPFFAWIEDNAAKLKAREPGPTQWLVQRSAALHLAHIGGGGDPFESGSARPLDFGHWSAHRLEVLSGHALRHGEAVAIGMALDTRYAQLAGLLDAASASRVQQAIRSVGLPTWHPALDLLDGRGVPEVLRGIEDFREHLGGSLSITMLREVGFGAEVHEVDLDHMRAAIASAPR